MAKPKLNANQVENFEYDNTTSGLTATTGKDAIDELVVDLADKLPVTGDAALAASFEVGIAANENKIQLPTGTGEVTIEGGTSPTAKGTIKTSTTGVNISFDGGATEYVIKKGGATANEDIVNKGYLDGRIIKMVESDITGLGASAIQINNIVALSQEDYEAIVTPDPNTYYLITDSATNYDYIALSCSDLTTNLAAGTNKGYFRMSYSGVLSEVNPGAGRYGVKAMVTEAPIGSNLIVDVMVNGSSILTQKLVIDAGSKTSVGSATLPVINPSTLSFDDEVRVDILQVGSTNPGKGLIVTFEIARS